VPLPDASFRVSSWIDGWDKYTVEVQETAIGCETGSRLALERDYNLILWEVASSDFYKIYSAVLNGLDITYPDESMELQWAFLKGIECAMTLCDKVAECFLDPDFLDTISEHMAGNGYILGGQSGTGNSGTGNGSAVLGNILAGTDVDCDNDAQLYGYCMQVVDTINRFVVDFIEIVQAQTSKYALAGNLVGLIPIFGSYAEKALQFADVYFSILADIYNASYTLEAQEFFACQIYEIAQENCSLTLSDIITAYGNGLNEALIPSSFDDFLDKFLGLDTTVGNTAVAVCHYSVLGIMQFSQRFLGFTLQSIPLFSGAYDNYPLPENCGSWCYELNMLDSLPSEVTVLYGVWVGGGNTGVRQEYGNGYRPDTEGTGIGSRAGVRVTFPMAGYVEKITFEILLDGRGANETPSGIGYRYIFNTENDFTQYPESNAVQTFEITPTQAIEGTYDIIFGYGWRTSGNYDPVPNIRIRKIKFEGSGSSPFGSENC